MITFNGPVAGQKTIGLHIEFLIGNLHDERCSQVDEVSIPDIGEQGIRKTFWILLQQFVKFCLPEKINKAFQFFCRLNTVVIIFKMINMKEFDVLQWLTL